MPGDPGPPASSARPPWWVAACATVLGFLLAIGLNYAYTTYSIHESRVNAQHQGEMLVHKLCTTLDRLHSAEPPAGNPVTNPSRGYLQTLHERLGELAGDIGC